MGIAHSTKSARMILKTAVSHRGTETTEAADKELYLRKALKNCDPLGEDKAPENRPPFHLLCALLKLSHSFNSVAISIAGFRIIVVPAPEVTMPELYNLSRQKGNEIDCPLLPESSQKTLRDAHW